jgi:hypothetical protein
MVFSCGYALVAQKTAAVSILVHRNRPQLASITAGQRFKGGSRFGRYRQGVAAPVLVVTTSWPALLDMPAASCL